MCGVVGSGFLEDTEHREVATGSSLCKWLGSRRPSWALRRLSANQRCPRQEQVSQGTAFLIPGSWFLVVRQRPRDKEVLVPNSRASGNVPGA